MIKIGLSGCGGNMGHILDELIEQDQDVELVFGVTKPSVSCDKKYPIFENPSKINIKCDVIIDFSNPEFTDELIKYCVESKTPLLIATTGLNEMQDKQIEQAAHVIPILKSSNTSLGVNVLIDLVKRATNSLSDTFDIEIIEKHHRDKVDAPSGTALMIANAINEQLEQPKTYCMGRANVKAKRQVDEIGIHAIRGGTICGEHTVIFAGLDEVIEIKHTALSKKVFANQAINIAKILIHKEPKLYSMDEFLNMKK